MCYNQVMLELLAPSGDIKSLDAAINCGCDAVYLGLEDFNARMRAENFTADNLARYVRRAHFFGVKVYLTINTILHNNELNKLFDIVKAAVLAKVDAYIVQDLGVAAVLKKRFEGIVLHASTQLGVHNLYGARVAERAGFSRVVLSRETKLEDIRAIKQNTALEIEFFVQGALCVCFSGNCYLSAVEQGASGNRGMCKQLCRLPYEARFSGKSEIGYMLSARDICLADSLKELADAGVSSFKIEGRMRGEGYVAQAVSVYRRLIDDIDCNARATGGELRGLKKAFGRGEYLTRAYLDKGVPNVIDKRFNNHVGIKIGKVEKVRPFKQDLNEIVVYSSQPLNVGDGLKFFEKDVERASLGVGEAVKVGKDRYRIISKTAVKEGWQVNLICDSAMEKELAQKRRYLPLRLSVRAVCAEPLEIRANFVCADGENIDIAVCSQTPLEKARTAPMGEQDIAAQCSKTADSGFEVSECSVITDGVFIAKSELNAARRELLDKMSNAVIAHNERNISVKDCGDIPIQKVGGGNSVLRFVRGEDNSSFMLKKGETAVLQPLSYGAEEIKREIDALGLDLSDTAIELPVIANGKDLEIITRMLSELPAVKTLVSENIYGLEFAQNGYRIIAGAGHNAANFCAVQQLIGLGASEVVASIEAMDDIAECTAHTTGAQEVPLMSFAHCPYKTVTDTNCSACSYRAGMTLHRGRHVYQVRRIRLSQCYFQLFEI